MKQYFKYTLRTIAGIYFFISGVVFYGDYVHPHVKVWLQPDSVTVVKFEVEK